MPNAKDIQKRIKSVKSTHKITRTMEMVATSKFKRAVDRLIAARPFAQALPEIVGLLAGEELGDFPLLARRSEVKRVGLLILTSNRGLCGSLNSNLLRKSMTFIRDQEEKGREVEIHVTGKKGASYLRFIGRRTASQRTDLSDRPAPEDAGSFATLLSEAFVSGRVDEVHIVYPSFKNAAEQAPVVAQLLPLSLPASEESGKAPANFILEPDAMQLLGELLPLYLRNTIFRCLLEMAASEQGARRTAMKAATDSAKEMMDSLTLSYNRARQAQITKELLEVISGAEALR